MGIEMEMGDMLHQLQIVRVQNRTEPHILAEQALQNLIHL